MAQLKDKYETLLVRQQGARLYLTLNRPESKNSISPTMVAELNEVFDALKTRGDIKAVVMRGSNGVFCAGADLKNMADMDVAKPAAGKDPLAATNRRFGYLLEKITNTPQVVVAAIEGHALAGGFGLACCSDVAICTENASFAMTETALGILPAQIAPFVAMRIGVPQTRHLTLTAARFKGAEAVRLGIGHYLVKDSAALDAKLEEVLKQIDKCAPKANAATKEIVLAVTRMPLHEVLDFASEKFAEARRGDEAPEGLKAFAEKRPPRWQLG
ncbi:MAG: enoyl-CoA hydratase/isomerase family protein [Reyranellaceae bacterium]